MAVDTNFFLKDFENFLIEYEANLPFEKVNSLKNIIENLCKYLIDVNSKI